MQIFGDDIFKNISNEIQTFFFFRDDFFSSNETLPQNIMNMVNK